MSRVRHKTRYNARLSFCFFESKFKQKLNCSYSMLLTTTCYCITTLFAKSCYIFLEGSGGFTCAEKLVPEDAMWSLLPFPSSSSPLSRRDSASARHSSCFSRNAASSRQHYPRSTTHSLDAMEVPRCLIWVQFCARIGEQSVLPFLRPFTVTSSHPFYASPWDDRSERDFQSRTW